MAAHGLLTHFIRILASVDHAIDKLVRLIQDRPLLRRSITWPRSRPLPISVFP
jgi:hypothetical protein